ncbi:MAG TPA: hypothetical protein VGD71_34335 [Kribbella sp.]|jgi:hypothetical protein
MYHRPVGRSADDRGPRCQETYERDYGYQYLLNVGPSKDCGLAKVYTDRLAEVGAALGVHQTVPDDLSRGVAGKVLRQRACLG